MLTRRRAAAAPQVDALCEEFLFELTTA